MKILITGVAGFIGSNLADHLLREYRHHRRGTQNSPLKIIGIDNLSYGAREQIPKDVEFYKMDIRSKDIYPLFVGVDYVFHLAAKNCLSDCQDDPVQTADINVTGTVNVFEAAKMAKVKKVIYAETSALYEGSRKFPTPESEIKPESVYANSKVASMYFAEAYKKFFKMKFTALRYFNVYGPRQDYRRTIPPIMSAFIIRLLAHQPPIIYGTGEKKRDFVYVDDVNDFHILCIKNSSTDGKVFNVGSGQCYSILDIYNFVCDFLGVKISPVYKENLVWEAEDTLANITQAKKLGWKPKTDIREGLTRMISYIQDEIRKGNIRLNKYKMSEV